MTMTLMFMIRRGMRRLVMRRRRLRMQTMNLHDSKTIHDTVRTSAATLLTHAPRSLSFLHSKGLDDNDATVAKNMMIVARCWTKILLILKRLICVQ